MSQQHSIQFHRLSFVQEGDDVVVGRVDTGSYAVLPLDGTQLLRHLFEGMPPDEAAQWYERTYGEPVDVDDFMTSLAELGFLRSPDEASTDGPRARFKWLGDALFSPPAALLYALLILTWVILAIHHRDIRPSPSQLFFTKSLIAMQLVVIASQFPLLCVHEGLHVLAGQRLGLASKLNISNRFTFVVVETQSNGLMSVPRRQRYLPLLAGMLGDLLALSVLGIVAELTRSSDGVLSLPGRICLAAAFTVVSRIGWQFLLYLRTDLYFVLATALNCHDLHDASKALMMNRLWRRLGRTDKLIDEDQWTEHDLKVGRWYGWFIGVGLLAAFGLTCFVTVPVTLTYLGRTCRALASGSRNGLFWDSAFSLSWNIFQFVLPAYLSRRKRRIDAGRGPRLLVNSGAV
jgi:hypothetical protein